MVDGIGGNVKRLVYSAIISGKRCQSATDFVRIAQSKTTAIITTEIEQQEIDLLKTYVENTFRGIKPVPETKKIHSINALANNTIEFWLLIFLSLFSILIRVSPLAASSFTLILIYYCIDSIS